MASPTRLGELLHTPVWQETTPSPRGSCGPAALGLVETRYTWNGTRPIERRAKTSVLVWLGLSWDTPAHLLTVLPPPASIAGIRGLVKFLRLWLH